MPKRDKKQSKRFKDYAWPRFPYCQWCGQSITREEATTDHIVPVLRGGSNGIWNLCLACVTCNKNRGSRRPTQLPPYGPRWRWPFSTRVYPSLGLREANLPCPPLIDPQPSADDEPPATLLASCLCSV